MVVIPQIFARVLPVGNGSSPKTKAAFYQPFIPVLLLWPLALIPIAHGLVARDARGIGLLKVIAATRGLRIAVGGGAGERFLIRVI